VRLQGLPVPQDGTIAPTDAPGFGLEIKEEWITPWRHGSPPAR
jgi:L-alanine-DL-glutamate epimerase-like enolase superfamily enzyme